MQAFWKRWAPDSTPEAGRRVVVQRLNKLYLGYWMGRDRWQFGTTPCEYAYVQPRLGDLWMYEEEVIQNIPAET